MIFLFSLILRVFEDLFAICTSISLSCYHDSMSYSIFQSFSSDWCFYSFYIFLMIHCFFFVFPHSFIFQFWLYFFHIYLTCYFMNIKLSCYCFVLRLNFHLLSFLFITFPFHFFSRSFSILHFWRKSSIPCKNHRNFFIILMFY